MDDQLTEVKLSRMRRAIGERMTISNQQVPHFYVTAEAAMDQLELAKTTATSGRVTVTAMILHAVAATLQEVPELNAIWRDGRLFRSTPVNLGVAIALDDGLVAPAIVDCQALTPVEIGDRLRDLADRARAGRLTARELDSATFTVSNLGPSGDVVSFAAIVVPPQVAILAIGRTQTRPVVRDDAITVGRIASLTVSADHRAVDGAVVARFLDRLKSAVETSGLPAPDPDRAPAPTAD